LIQRPQILQEVPGEGMFNEATGKKGSLFIRFNIKFPTNLSEGAKK
jgi:DnaJ-class molecular chaperone